MQEFIKHDKTLTDFEVKLMEQQDTRLVSEHKAKMLEIEAKKHWDLFYKRNENRFFKDRHWTTREFTELLNDNHSDQTRTILEVGCGVGNLIFPLIEERLNFNVIACDLSPRAVDLVKSNPLFDEKRMKAFQADITTDDVFKEVELSSIDVITMIFVLSAIHPDKFEVALKNALKLLKPGGVLLFRDYGLYDMAQLRFKAGHKIADNFYMRQDGTRSYYFSTSFTEDIFKRVGFEIISNNYVHRRTINVKENIDVPRIYNQGKFIKKFTKILHICVGCAR